MTDNRVIASRQLEHNWSVVRILTSRQISQQFILPQCEHILASCADFTLFQRAAMNFRPKSLNCSPLQAARSQYKVSNYGAKPRTKLTR